MGQGDRLAPVVNPLFFVAAAALAAAAAYAYNNQSDPVTEDAGDDSTSALSVGSVYATGATSSDQDTLARTIYGEARGQGATAMEDVASVIMNRYRLVQAGQGYKSFGGPSITAICLAPSQFSCWNVGDPNLAVCRQVDASDPVFAQALNIAAAAISGQLVDRTGGADHYFATASALPSWAQGVGSTLQDGAHTFLKLIGASDDA